MVRRRTASHVLTRRNRPGVSQHPIPRPQGTMARPSGGMRVGAPWPMAMRVGEPAGHRERVARPQPPDKTAHRLQHTQIERAGLESQTACELRRVMRTNPQGTLAAKYASVPAVFTPYAISTRAMQDPLLCSSNCRRNCSVVLPPPPPPSPSLPPLRCHCCHRHRCCRRCP